MSGVLHPMLELSGSLKFVSLARLLRMLTEIRGSGQLYVTKGSVTGSLFMQDGQVIGAVFGSDFGQAALGAIALALDGAGFRFSGEVIQNPIRNLSLDAGELQRRLETLSAEGARLSSVLPSLDALLVQSDQLSDDDDLITIDRGTLRLLVKCDGRRTVIDLARADGVHPTLSRIARLIELRLVECKLPHETVDGVAEVGRVGAWARWRQKNPTSVRARELGAQP